MGKTEKIRETLLTRTCENRGENPIMHFVDGSPNQVQFLASFQGGNAEFETIRGKLAVALLSHFHFPTKFLIGRVRLFRRESRSSLELYNVDETETRFRVDLTSHDFSRRLKNA